MKLKRAKESACVAEAEAIVYIPHGQYNFEDSLSYTLQTLRLTKRGNYVDMSPL